MATPKRARGPRPIAEDGCRPSVLPIVPTPPDGPRSRCQADEERVWELVAALARFMDAGLLPDPEWASELAALLKVCRDRIDAERDEF